MSDELKEILESLDKIAKAEYYPEDLLTYKECQLLLNYITNLQEENEELKKEKKKISQQHIYTLDKLIETQTKNENAIEYLNEPNRDEFDYSITYLLEILQGGDEE